MLRDRGNKSYSKKEMHAALAFYSQAIVAAPVNSRETALAIGTFYYSVLFTLNLYLQIFYLRPAYIFKFHFPGNRSATFFEMHDWKKCLDDIEGKES